MAIETAFETLIELALQDTNEAAKRLGHAVRASAQAQEKLNLLISYQHDYIGQLAKRLSSGVSGQQHRNFQEFIAGLERAILQQSEVCKSCQQAAGHELDLWRDSERKRLSYETLAQRQTLSAQRRERQRDQKQTDEHAARSRRTLN